MVNWSLVTSFFFNPLELGSHPGLMTEGHRDAFAEGFRGRFGLFWLGFLGGLREEGE